MSTKTKKIVTIISFIIFIGVVILITYFVGKPLMQFSDDPEKFSAYIDSFGVGSRIVLIGIQFLQVFIAFIPGEFVEVGAGYIFGGLEGAIMCIIGCVLASSCVYYLISFFGIKAVEVFVSKEKITQLKFINNSKKLNTLVFALFFIPGTPKDLLTYFIGLTPMKLSTFLIISNIARLPSVLSSTFGGQAIRSGEHSLAIWIFAITGIVSLIGIFIYKKIVAQKN